MKMTIWKDIIADYGAIADGTTDNLDAFMAFRTWARQQEERVGLFIPAGDYALSSTLPFDGIRNLVVSGYGAKLPRVRLTGLGGFRQEANYSARVETVAAGATAVNLVDPAKAAIFTVGDWCCLSALEWQGMAGYPPSHHYVQYVQITGIDGEIISISPPATQNYSAEYPTTSSGVYDTGGPATLHLMVGKPGGSFDRDSWDVEVEVRGLTVETPTPDQIYLPGRKVTLIDCSFFNCAPIPSQNKEFLAIRCSCDTWIENDKDCEVVEWRDCDLLSMTVQSASIDTLIINGSKFDKCHGTARHTLIKGPAEINLIKLGPHGYGSSESLTVEAPAIIKEVHAVTFNRKTYEDFLNDGGDLTYQGQVLAWGAPGSILVLGTNSMIFGYTSRVDEVTTAAGKKVLHTAFPAPLPTLPAEWWGPPSYIMQHPMPSVTVERGVTGCPMILDMAAAPDGLPFACYFDRTGDFIAGGLLWIWGKLVSVEVDVIVPYTGAQAIANFQVGGFYNNSPIRKPDGTAGIFGPKVNAKVVGKRTITPTAITGAQAGDAMGAAPGDIWFPTGIYPRLFGDYSGDAPEALPTIRITMRTEQLPIA